MFEERVQDEREQLVDAVRPAGVVREAYIPSLRRGHDCLRKP